MELMKLTNLSKRFKENHILPIVRIQKIELNNFKNVKHGEIILNGGKKTTINDSEPDILGIYGQNGSGKTSVIEALSILEHALMGTSIPAKYSECINSNSDYATLSFTFNFLYPSENDYVRTIVYSFKISSITNEAYSSGTFDSIDSLFKTRVKLFDEVISASGFFEGEIQKKQIILSTSNDGYPIGPVRKKHYYISDPNKGFEVMLKVNQSLAIKESKSFLFMGETLDLFEKYGNYSEYYQILIELNYYATLYLYSIDSRATGLGASFALPFNTRQGVLAPILMDIEAPKLSTELFEDFKALILNINTVLPALIPDMKLEYTNIETTRNGKHTQEVRLFSRRNETYIPLRDESAGIIKLICILSLIIAAYNDRSITIAIDELDAGVYEYLLGEILYGFERYGKGQFIFTSHNLRPLEVLRKENIIFTTTNPENRYIRLKGVGQSNNLRNLYFREIFGNDQDERMYDAANIQLMIKAIRKAGVGFAEKK